MNAPITMPTQNGSRESDPARLDRLERELAEIRWCFVEFLWKLKVQAIRQQMEKPEVREQLAQAMLAKLEQQA